MSTEQIKEAPTKQQIDLSQGQFKEILVFAICGAGFHTLPFANFVADKGLAKWTGPTGNQTCEWIPEKLSALTNESLLSIFREIRGHNVAKNEVH